MIGNNACKNPKMKLKTLFQILFGEHSNCSWSNSYNTVFNRASTQKDILCRFK